MVSRPTDIAACDGWGFWPRRNSQRGLMPRRDGPADIIDLIYDAAVDASLWRRVVNRLADLCGATTAHLLSQNSETRRVMDIARRRTPRPYAAMRSTGSTITPWGKAWHRTPAGPVVSSDALMPKREFARTAFYNEFLPGGMTEALASKLLAEGSVEAGVAVCTVPCTRARSTGGRRTCLQNLLLTCDAPCGCIQACGNRHAAHGVRRIARSTRSSLRAGRRSRAGCSPIARPRKSSPIALACIAAPTALCATASKPKPAGFTGSSPALQGAPVSAATLGVTASVCRAVSDARRSAFW